MKNPTGPKTGLHREVRGGAWGSVADNCRSADRLGWYPGNRGSILGVRLARRVQK